MLKRLRNWTVGLAAGLCWALPAVAQSVTPTSGAGDVGTVIIGTSDFTVTGGTQQLNTLFHSFEDFSPEAANVSFQLDGSQSAVEYVIGRVTGNDLSLIDGQLSLKGGSSPDLFLINPNGITFGNNASLDLPGSFIPSTAESMLFNGGLTFSATNPGTAPVLTVSTPIGLQMGSTSGDIQVNNIGHDLTTAGVVSPVTFGTTPTGLQVNANSTLALVGNNITLDGGILSATDGRTLLGAVATNNTVSLAPFTLGWQIDYDAVSSFGNIDLTQSALINVGNTGAAQLRGNNLTFQDGSAIFQVNNSNQTANPIQLLAAGTIAFGGGNTSNFNSGIIGDVTASGQGGIIDISAIRLVAEGIGGNILRSFTFGDGNGSDISIEANQVDLQLSLIALRTFGTGNTGNLDVNANTINLADSALISNVNGGTGNAGNIVLNAADQIVFGPNIESDTLITSSAVSATGNAGNITKPHLSCNP